MPMKTQLNENAGERVIGLDETDCAHQRITDEILTKGGKRTGKVRCLECRTIFDDPYKCNK